MLKERLDVRSSQNRWPSNGLFHDQQRRKERATVSSL